jgi:hypothetical protein
MVTGKEPWEDQKSLVEIAIGVSSRGWRLPIPDNCPPQLAGTTHLTPHAHAHAHTAHTAHTHNEAWV